MAVSFRIFVHTYGNLPHFGVGVKYCIACKNKMEAMEKAAGV